MQKNITIQEPDVLLVVSFSARAFITDVAVDNWTLETLVPAPRGAANLFQRARECPKTKILIIYADALSACMSALEQDLNRSEWQQDWVDEAGSLFEFRRHYSDRCQMGELRQWAGSGTEPPLTSLEDVTAAISVAISSPSRVAMSVAKEVIAGNLALREWDERLAASSRLRQEPDKELESTASDAEVMWREFAAVKQKLDKEREEHEKQIAQLQVELEDSLEDARKAREKDGVAGTEIQQRYDQQALELEIANIQIAQLQDELALSLRELDALASSKGRPGTGVDIEIKPHQVRRLLSWSGHNNLQGKPSWLMASSARRERERTLVEDIKLLVESDYFDADWYRSQSGGHLGRLDPVEHFLRHGASQGRDPSPRFDTTGYLLANPDVVTTGMNPLVHYLRHGRQEKRSPRPIDHAG